jgi:hypothetical protein
VYVLKYDVLAEAAHDALPRDASEALTLALADACRDPLGATVPYGEDDKIMRMVVTDHAFAVLLLGHVLGTLTVLQISSLA